MLSSFPSQTELVQIAETALIATVGGVGFYLIGFPGGLVSGSMLAVAIAALAGRPMKIPMPMARVCFVLVSYLERWSRRTRSMESRLGRSVSRFW